MTTTIATTLEEAGTALILKAARRYAHESGISIKHAEARLDTMGEVAADILGIAMTPFSFGQTIKATLEAHPIPGPTGSAAHNIERRIEWEHAFVKAYRSAVI